MKLGKWSDLLKKTLEKRKQKTMATAFDAIKLAPNQKIKVWDVLLTPEGIRHPYQLQPILHKLESRDYEDHTIPRGLWKFVGRIRILAVMDKKPEALDNIRFSIAYCAPTDLFKYTRKRANDICVGRWNNTFANDDMKLSMPTVLNKCTGVIPHLETLKGFVEQALFNVEGLLPQWVHAIFFESPELVKRLYKETV